MFDGEAFGEQMVAIVRDYVDSKTAPLHARIAELEAREIPVAINGEKGEPGEVDMDVVSAMVADAVAKSVAEIQLPEPAPAPEVDMDAVASLIDEAVSKIPTPVDGKSCDMDEVREMVSTSVQAAVAEIPVAKDGTGLADALINSEGQLVLTLTDGRVKTLSRVVGKDAEPAVPTPPFTLDDFDIVPTGERTIEMKFTHGNECHTFELAFPVPVYRGVYSQAEKYERGDMVTWAGSIWHCDEAKGLKPDAPEGGWRLAVKRGRDGKGVG